MYPCPNTVVIYETGKRTWLGISAGGFDGPMGRLMNTNASFRAPGSCSMYNFPFGLRLPCDCRWDSTALEPSPRYHLQSLQYLGETVRTRK